MGDHFSLKASGGGKESLLARGRDIITRCEITVLQRQVERVRKGLYKDIQTCGET